MAELNTGGDDGGKGKKKVRSKKQNSKVDLTAMVDLAFLLITFFMLTTSLSKPQSMDLGMPDKDDKQELEIKIAQERTMNIVIGPDGKLKSYMGQLNDPIEPVKDFTYGKEGIRRQILEKMVSVPQFMGDPKKGLIVLIKADKKSTYKNLVDILDEMAICKVPTYAIVDITKEESALFK
jgi:biopolymer transport protein ExbD